MCTTICINNCCSWAWENVFTRNHVGWFEMRFKNCSSNSWICIRSFSCVASRMYCISLFSLLIFIFLVYIFLFVLLFFYQYRQICIWNVNKHSPYNIHMYRIGIWICVWHFFFVLMRWTCFCNRKNGSHCVQFMDAHIVSVHANGSFYI